MMYAYYRSDCRLPTEIFRDGFLPSYSDPDDITFSTALKKYPEHDSVSFVPDVTNSSAQDIYSPYAVCMSRKFESAAIFPVEYFAVNSYICGVITT